MHLYSVLLQLRCVLPLAAIPFAVQCSAVLRSTHCLPSSTSSTNLIYPICLVGRLGVSGVHSQAAGHIQHSAGASLVSR